MFFVLVLLFITSILYSITSRFSWFIPYIIFIYCIILLFYTILSIAKRGRASVEKKERKDGDKKEKEKKEYDLNPEFLGWVWIVWIIYGSVFGGIPNLINVYVFSDPPGTVFALVESVFIMLDVLLFRFMKPTSRKVTIFLFALLMTMALPNSDMVSLNLGIFTMLIKSALFFILYFLNEIHSVLEASNHNHPVKEVGIHCEQCKLEMNVYYEYIRNGSIIISSVWVLLISNYLLFFALFEIIPILWRVYLLFKSNTYKFDKKNDSKTNSSTKPEKVKTKKSSSSFTSSSTSSHSHTKSNSTSPIPSPSPPTIDDSKRAIPKKRTVKTSTRKTKSIRASPPSTSTVSSDDLSSNNGEVTIHIDDSELGNLKDLLR